MAKPLIITSKAPLVNHADGTGLIIVNGVARTRNGIRYDRRICAGCGEEKFIARGSKFCSNACKGWKGSQAGYSAMHYRIRRLRGSADSCIWGCDSILYHWANLTGDYGDPDDYASMCVSCHGRYDAARRSMEVNGTESGHRVRKLTPADVRKIRESHSIGISNKAIADEYGVVPSLISSIIHGARWAWVK